MTYPILFSNQIKGDKYLYRVQVSDSSQWELMFPKDTEQAVIDAYVDTELARQAEEAAAAQAAAEAAEEEDEQ
jgi:hypothetical protein